MTYVPITLAGSPGFTTLIRRDVADALGIVAGQALTPEQCRQEAEETGRRRKRERAL